VVLLGEESWNSRVVALGGNECGVWIVEEDPHACFGNGTDVGVHVLSSKTPCARSESGGNKCGVWIVEEDPHDHFGNGRDAVSLSKTPRARLESRGD
jgi:hypothetical protein